MTATGINCPNGHVAVTITDNGDGTERRCCSECEYDVNATRTVAVGIDTEFIETTIEMAGYGISYWVAEATHDEEAKTYTLVCYEDPDDPAQSETHVLTYAAIATAIQRIHSNDQRDLPDYHWVGQYLRDYLIGMDAGMMDSDLADCVVQLAAFGEVRYG